MRMTWLFLVIGFMGCGNSTEIERLNFQLADAQKTTQSLERTLNQTKVQLAGAIVSKDRLKFISDQLQGVKAKIITNYGDIELSLLPEKAPLHTFTFVTRAESGFYNSTQFHRIIPGFMIQGGDPKSKDADPVDDGTGGPLVHIPHEFNDVSHVRGVLSTARVSDKSVGAGSQFFIMHGENTGLDQLGYTVFGKVEKGMDVVDRIASVQTFKTSTSSEDIALRNRNPNIGDHPTDPVLIRTIVVYR